MSFNFSCSLLYNTQIKDAKIFVLNTYEGMARRVFCEVIVQGGYKIGHPLLAAILKYLLEINYFFVYIFFKYKYFCVVKNRGQRSKNNSATLI